MYAIPGQANTRTADLVAKADGTAITSGTVNFYLRQTAGTNAGRWWRGSDSTWQSAEAVAGAMTHLARGHWTVSVAAGAWEEGAEYLEYAAESGWLDVPLSRLVRANKLLAEAAALPSIDTVNGVNYAKSTVYGFMGALLAGTAALIATAFSKLFDIATPRSSVNDLVQTDDLPSGFSSYADAAAVNVFNSPTAAPNVTGIHHFAGTYLGKPMHKCVRDGDGVASIRHWSSSLGGWVIHEGATPTDPPIGAWFFDADTAALPDSVYTPGGIAAGGVKCDPVVVADVGRLGGSSSAVAGVVGLKDTLESVADLPFAVVTKPDASQVTLYPLVPRIASGGNSDSPSWGNAGAGLYLWHYYTSDPASLNWYLGTVPGDGDSVAAGLAAPGPDVSAVDPTGTYQYGYSVALITVEVSEAIGDICGETSGGELLAALPAAVASSLAEAHGAGGWGGVTIETANITQTSAATLGEVGPYDLVAYHDRAFGPYTIPVPASVYGATLAFNVYAIGAVHVPVWSLDSARLTISGDGMTVTVLDDATHTAALGTWRYELIDVDNNELEARGSLSVRDP